MFPGIRAGKKTPTERCRRCRLQIRPAYRRIGIRCSLISYLQVQIVYLLCELLKELDSSSCVGMWSVTNDTTQSNTLVWTWPYEMYELDIVLSRHDILWHSNVNPASDYLKKSIMMRTLLSKRDKHIRELFRDNSDWCTFWYWFLLR